MTEHKQHKEQPLIEDMRSFYFGLATGVAAVSLIGILFFMSGLAKKELGASDPQVAKQAQKTTNQAKSGEKYDIKVGDNERFRGNKNAKITIVEFSDIQCPYCSRFHETMKQVMQNYPNDVKWVFKHFPLESLHPYAKLAAEATECAGDQDRFWELTDKYYENQSSLSPEYVVSAAEELGLDMPKFKKCLADKKYAKKVEDDFAYGKAKGVRGTPGSFINGISIPGALPYSDIEQMIQEQLAK
jgi:protein-disulfide isomerase